MILKVILKLNKRTSPSSSLPLQRVKGTVEMSHGGPERDILLGSRKQKLWLLRPPGLPDYFFPLWHLNFFTLSGSWSPRKLE